MGTYLVEIIRSELASFSERVADEEAGASEFTGNQVATLEGRATNLASFKTLNPGELPQPARFAEIGALPNGAVPLWTGVVLLGAKTVAVAMFRAAN